jgi:hypothetical protein
VANGPRPALRVLQAIADTDPIGTNLQAVALHRALVELGVEMRTLALAPGTRPGLEAAVPTIAPGRRTIAARSAWRTESRWADVVVLHGARAATWATARGRDVDLPVVVAYWDAGEWPRRVGRAERHLLDRAVVVVPDATIGSALTRRRGAPPDLAPQVLGSSAPEPSTNESPLDARGWCELLRAATSTGDGR